MRRHVVMTVCVMVLLAFACFFPLTSRTETTVTATSAPVVDPSPSPSPQLVKDILPGVNGSITTDSPQPPVRIGSAIYFIADDGVHGRELWRSDATTAGTFMVKDIMPGPGSSYPNPQNIVNSAGVIYFRADDGIHGSEMWRSDGTAAGTYMLKDIVPGITSSGAPHLQEQVDMGGTLIFTAQVGGLKEIWRSDGTEAGTFSINGSTPPGDPRNLFAVGGRLVFFAASDPVHERELWRTDGTAAGMFMVPAGALLLANAWRWARLNQRLGAIRAEIQQAGL